MRSVKGSVAILSLWMMSLMSVFVLTTGKMIHYESALLGREQTAFATRHTFEGLVSIARDVLLAEATADLDSYDEAWYSAKFAMPTWAADFDLRISDEESRLDLNSARSGQILALLRQIEIYEHITFSEDPDELAEAIIEYRHAKNNRRFESLPELLFIPIVSPETYALIKPYITMHVVNPIGLQVNINTVSKPVFDALLETLRGDNFVRMALKRSVHDALLSPETRRVVFSARELTPRSFMIKLDLEPSPQMSSLVNRLMPLLRATSNNFRIKMTNRSLMSDVEAIVRRAWFRGDDFHILAWHQA